MSLPVEVPVSNSVQDQPGFGPEPVELVDEELIELAVPGVLEDLAAFRPALQGDGAGNAVVGVDAVRGQVVQLTVAFPELDLRPDGLALSLLFGADAGVNGGRHTALKRLRHEGRSRRAA